MNQRLLHFFARAVMCCHDSAEPTVNLSSDSQKTGNVAKREFSRLATSAEEP